MLVTAQVLDVEIAPLALELEQVIVQCDQQRLACRKRLPLDWRIQVLIGICEHNGITEAMLDARRAVTWEWIAYLTKLGSGLGVGELPITNDNPSMSELVRFLKPPSRATSSNPISCRASRNIVPSRNGPKSW